MKELMEQLCQKTDDKICIMLEEDDDETDDDVTSQRLMSLKATVFVQIYRHDVDVVKTRSTISADVCSRPPWFILALSFLQVSPCVHTCDATKENSLRNINTCVSSLLLFHLFSFL